MSECREMQERTDKQPRLSPDLATCSDARTQQDLEAELAKVFEVLPDLFFRIDSTGVIKGYRAQRESQLYLPPDQFLGRKVQEVLPPEASGKIADATEKALTTGNLQTFEYNLPMPSGVETFEVRMAPVGPSGDLIAIARCITENKRAVEALRESEELLRTLMNSMPDIVCFKDGQGRWLEANDFDLKLFELEGVDYRGKKDSELAPFSDFYREAFLTCEETDEHAWKSGGAIRADEVIPRPDGSVMTFDIIKVPTFNPDGSRKGLVVVGRDITQRRKAEADRAEMEAQLRHSQKMEAVGRLAGGIAHDFNNMLNVILLAAQMALDTVPADHPAHTELEEIMKASHNSIELTRQLLTFARKEEISPRSIDPNQEIASAKKFLTRLIGENIELVFTPGQDLWNMIMDPSQLSQILANLAVNSRDSIDGMGRIDIQTSNVSLPHGDFVQICFSDNGSGIPLEIREKIFDPFFTTKDQGKGTGLGLSTIYGIVRQNEGQIDLESEPGKGTIFKIYIPKG